MAYEENDLEIDESIVEIAGGLISAHTDWATPQDSHVTAFNQPVGPGSEAEVVAFETDDESIPAMLEGLHEYLSEVASASSLVGVAWFGTAPSDNETPQQSTVNCAVWNLDELSYVAFYVAYTEDAEGVIELGDIVAVAEKPGGLFDQMQMHEPDDLVRDHSIHLN